MRLANIDDIEGRKLEQALNALLRERFCCYDAPEDEMVVEVAMILELIDDYVFKKLELLKGGKE